MAESGGLGAKDMDMDMDMDKDKDKDAAVEVTFHSYPIANFLV